MESVPRLTPWCVASSSCLRSAVLPRACCPLRTAMWRQWDALVANDGRGRNSHRLQHTHTATLLSALYSRRRARARARAPGASRGVLVDRVHPVSPEPRATLGHGAHGVARRRGARRCREEHEHRRHQRRRPEEQHLHRGQHHLQSIASQGSHCRRWREGRRSSPDGRVQSTLATSARGVIKARQADVARSDGGAARMRH